MKTIHITGILILMIVAQWFVPASMIYNQEHAISDGSIYKFKTQPIDPTDPFRGKYITLTFDINSYQTTDTLWKGREKGFAYFTKDENGYAVLEELTPEKINSELDYVEVKIRYVSKNKVRFNLPFNVYYMEESKAYDAEVAHRDAQRDTVNTTYAVVHIKDDVAVLTDVKINDISIKDYVENNKIIEESND